MFDTSKKNTTYLGMAYVISVLLDRAVFPVFQAKFLFQNGTYFKYFSSGFDYLFTGQALRCYSCVNLYKNVECSANNPVHCGSSSDRCAVASFSYKTNETSFGQVETFYRECTTAASCETATSPCRDSNEATCEYKCCAEDLCNNSGRSFIFITNLVTLACFVLLLYCRDW